MHKYIDNSESFNAEVCTSPTSRLFDLKSRSVVLLYRRKNYNNNKKVSLFKYFWTKLYLLCYQTHSLPAAASSAAEHFLLSPLCILPAETKRKILFVALDTTVLAAGVVTFPFFCHSVTVGNAHINHAYSFNDEWNKPKASDWSTCSRSDIFNSCLYMVLLRVDALTWLSQTHSFGSVLFKGQQISRKWLAGRGTKTACFTQSKRAEQRQEWEKLYFWIMNHPKLL